MFNLKKEKLAQVSSYETYLRDNAVTPDVNDLEVTEQQLDHKDKGDKTILQSKLVDEHTNKPNDTSQVVEKVLDEAMSNYVDFRGKDNNDLVIPPINDLVNKIQEKRMKTDYKTEKKEHWTNSEEMKNQNGDLPEWPKIKASLDHVAKSIKEGSTRDYDATIVSILEKASQEKRDLTAIEQHTINTIKVARTKAFIK